jgi:hypothetical protein
MLANGELGRQAGFGSAREGQARRDEEGNRTVGLLRIEIIQRTLRGRMPVVLVERAEYSQTREGHGQHKQEA